MNKASGLLATILLVIVGCAHKDKSKNEKKNPIPSLKPITIKYGHYDHYITTYGNVASQRAVNVHSEVSGKVVEIYVNEGDYVKEGTPLVKIDDQLLRKQFQEVMTQYELAESTFIKQKRLYEQGIGSEIAYLQARTQRDALKSRLDLLKEQLQKTTVVSPITGYVNRIYVRLGQMAMPQVPVVNIVGHGKTFVDAYVPESFYPLLKRGQKVVLEYRQLGCTDTGIVKYVSPYVEPRSRSVFVRVEPEGRCQAVPNMSCVAHIYVKRYDSVAIVPRYAVVESSDGKPTVMILEPTDSNQDTIFILKSVRIREVASTSTTLVIDSGIPDGAFIVGLEARSLSAGQHVRILKENKQ